MRITVDIDLKISLDDVDNLKELSCEVRALKDHAALTKAIEAIGARFEEDHIWAPIEWLRVNDDASWNAEFDTMINYARSKNWVNGSFLRAHVKWLK